MAGIEVRPGRHSLKDVTAPSAGRRCHVCKKMVPVGATLQECRECDWYRCEACRGVSKTKSLKTHNVECDNTASWQLLWFELNIYFRFIFLIMQFKIFIKVVCDLLCDMSEWVPFPKGLDVVRLWANCLPPIFGQEPRT